MFKTEIEILQDMVKSTIEEDKAAVLQKKIVNLKNISKTMTSLIKSIVNEVDNTREQMFKILESYAALEMSKDAKKFNKE